MSENIGMTTHSQSKLKKFLNTNAKSSIRQRRQGDFNCLRSNYPDTMVGESYTELYCSTDCPQPYTPAHPGHHVENAEVYTAEVLNYISNEDGIEEMDLDVVSHPLLANNEHIDVAFKSTKKMGLDKALTVCINHGQHTHFVVSLDLKDFYKI